MKLFDQILATNSVHVRRFVVLYHVVPTGSERASHWDFMLEHESTLRTWALADEPSDGTSKADMLPDHRLAYLEFEGALSENRGEVRRWDVGTYTILSECEWELSVRLEGEKLRGTAILTRDDSRDQRWRFSFASDSARA